MPRTKLIDGIRINLTAEEEAQRDIEEAKALPLPSAPEITRMEYDMKDQLIRQTIMTTQEDVKEIKEQMIRMEDKIDNLK